MIPPGTLLGGTQVQLGASPIIGQVDGSGRAINLASLKGWWDEPGTSGTKTQKPNDHGAFIGPAYYNDRVIELKYNVDGFSAGDSLLVARAIKRYLTLDSLVQLSVTDENETLTAMVRQEGDPLLDRKGNRVVVSLSMSAPDPRRYSGPTTVTTGLPTQSGGMVLPLVLPLSLGGTSQSGAVNATNTGDMDSNPIFTVFGPCAPFTITDSAGRQLYYASTVDTGRKLVMDGNTRLALLDGTALRPVTGTWPRLLPDPDVAGGVNQFYFNATSYDAGSQLSVTYRSARR